MNDITTCCSKYDVNNDESSFFNVTSGPAQLNRQQSVDATYSRMRFIINYIVLPVVFGAGVAGNALNAVLLSRRRGSTSASISGSPTGRPTAFERSAAAGLVALSASDFAFCLVGFARVLFLGTPPSGGWRAVAGLYYSIYRVALHNLFLFSSTWLIALVSVERCLAVCYPFRAGALIRVRRTIAAHIVVFAVSGVINVPLFLRSTVVSVTSCRSASAADGIKNNSTLTTDTSTDSDDAAQSCGLFYYAQPSALSVSQPGLLYGHKVVWFALGTFLPLILIVYSNVRLVREICRIRSTSAAGAPASASRSSSKGCIAGGDHDRSSTVTLTLTLIAIGVCFLVLVCPSMAIQFWRFASYESYGEGEGPSSTGEGRVEAFAILVTNLTQAIKFSSNFLLYLVVNRSFRRTFNKVFGVGRCNDRRQRCDDDAGRACSAALIEPGIVQKTPPPHSDIVTDCL